MDLVAHIRQAPKTKGRGVPTVVALRAWVGDGLGQVVDLDE